jgi:Reverse transcriptase (RNA-dependent DNA polymerase)
MPFGLTNAPASFQAIINHVLRNYLDQFVVVYLDDILIFSETPEEHERHVHQVLETLEDAQLLIEPEKAKWHTKEVKYLSYCISPGKISIDPEKVRAIRDWPRPQNVRDVRSVLGFMNFYRRFVKGYSQVATPLTQLTKKDQAFE